jgi:outer membrane protein assembly factor BamB
MPSLRSCAVRFASSIVAAFLASALAAADWPHWRGPELRGSSPETGLPVKWSLEEGLAWKLALPTGSGSTPIVLGDRIFLNVAEGDTVSLWCLDRKTSAVQWKKLLGASAGHAHRKHNMSTPSPVTDGKRVWAMTGQGALKGFDLSGQELWARDLQKEYGPFGTNWGYGSSALLHEGVLYVPVLHGMKTDDPSYVLKIDKMTGRTLWRVERLTDALAESPDSYTTPLWVDHGGLTELVITGGDVVSGHDPATGAEKWRANVLNPQKNRNYRIVASPTFAGGFIIAPTRNNPMTVLRPGGRGDVSTSHVVWQFDRGPDVPTPVSDGTYLYVVRDGGQAFCLDLKTGAIVYGPERLPPGTYSASPILADGRIYVTTEEEGLTTVFRAGPKFEILASNALAGDCSPYCLSTVAISEGQIFLRTSSYLWAIGERRK